MTDGKKIISNIFYYFLDLLTVTVAGYIFWMLMGKMLPPEQYGVLTAVVALFYVVSTITMLGFTEALPKLLPELLSRGRREALGGMIKYALKIATVFGVFVSLAIWFGAGKLSQMFYGNTGMAMPLQALAAMLFIANIGNVAKAALQGMQNFRAMFASDLVGSVGRLFVAAGLVTLGWAAIGGLAAWVFYFAVLAVICGALALKAHPAGQFDRRELWRFSSPSMFSLLGYYLILQGGVLVLAALTNAQTVAYFGVAVLFGQVLIFIPTVIAGALLPSISELWVGHKEKVQKLLSASIKLTFLTVLPFTILFILGSRLLVQLVYSSQYISAATLFPAYMAASFLYGPVILLLITLYAIGKPMTRLAIIAAGAIINIGACFVLVPAIGLTGAAFAFMTSQVVMLLASLVVVTRSARLHFSKRSLMVIPAAIVFGAILWTHNFVSSVWLKVLIALVALAVYGLVLLATKVVGKKELILLDYFPDSFGPVKKLANAMAGMFA